jgi:hypothetical protein
MTICELCGAQTGDYANVCTRCGEGLRRSLEDIPGLDAELDTTAYRQAKMGAGNAGGGRSDEKPMPVNLDADALGRRLKTVLATWCDLVSDQRGIPHPLDGLAPMSRWLLGHVMWLRHHPAGADAVVEIRDAVRDVWNVIDRPRDRVFAGYCGCGNPLYAREDAPQAVCRVCVDEDGQRPAYSVTEQRDGMLAAMEVMSMRPPEAAYALSILVYPITAELIRTWAARGKLQPSGVDEKGRNVYRLGDIAALMIPVEQAS